jgi:hypothetical protein
MRGRELAHCGLVCGLVSREIWVQTSHRLVMAQILWKCAVSALESVHVGDDVDFTQVEEVFEEKVRSSLCELYVD